MRKHKHIFSLAVFILLSTMSCKNEKNCPAFDFSIPQMDWFLFPENAEAYAFISSNGITTFELSRVSYEYTQPYSFETDGALLSSGWGSGDDEFCSSSVEAEYNFGDLDISIQNRISIQQDERLQFSDVSVYQDGLTIIRIESEDISSEEAVENRNTIELNGQTFTNVIGLYLPNEKGSLWISKEIGLVAVLIEGDTLTLR